MTSRALVRKSLFWGGVATIGYAYVGFPALVGARAAVRPRPLRPRDSTDELRVSLIVAAHNEADVIGAKLDNLATLDLSPERLEVIIASDGSTDSTVDLVEDHPSAPICLDLPRGGKNPTLNAAVEIATGDVLVFSDADSTLDPGSLEALLAPLADPEVGGVVGDLRYRPVDGAAGEQGYWSFDRRMKQLQSDAGSVTSATGQLHAIRRELWRPVPSGVADDSYTSLCVTEARRRLVFAPGAVARGDVETDDDLQLRRKSRYIARGLRSVWLHRRACNPLTHGWYAVQLLSHKVVRRLVAVPIVGLLVLAGSLVRQGRTYRAAFVLQTAFHLAALIGWLTRDRLDLPRPVRKGLSLPMYFDLVNLAVLRALRTSLTGERRDVWTPERGATG